MKRVVNLNDLHLVVRWQLVGVQKGILILNAKMAVTDAVWFHIVIFNFIFGGNVAVFVFCISFLFFLMLSFSFKFRKRRETWFLIF